MAAPSPPSRSFATSQTPTPDKMRVRAGRWILSVLGASLLRMSDDITTRSTAGPTAPSPPPTGPSSLGGPSGPAGDPPSDDELLDLARAAAARAYVPYSGFPVGAAVLTAAGTVVMGCNVENASYGLAICAERTACTRMCAENDADDADARRIVGVAVIGLKAAPCFPCGACRQVLNEFGCEYVVVDEEGVTTRYAWEEILPHGFGPDDL